MIKVRNIVHVLLSNSAFLEDGDTTEKLEKEQRDAAVSLDEDKRNRGEQGGGLFNSIFQRAPGIYDPSDGVHRCPHCNWELEGPYCARCDEDYSLDGSALDFSDVESSSTEDEDEEEDGDSHLQAEEVVDRIVRRPSNTAESFGWESEAGDGSSVRSETDHDLMRIRHAALADDWHNRRSHLARVSREHRATFGSRSTSSSATEETDAENTEAALASPGDTTAPSNWPAFLPPDMTDEDEFDSEMDDFIDDDETTDRGSYNQDGDHDLNLEGPEEEPATVHAHRWSGGLDNEGSLRSSSTISDDTGTGYDSESLDSYDTHGDYDQASREGDTRVQDENEPDILHQPQAMTACQSTQPNGRKRRMVIIDDTDDDDETASVQQEGRRRQRRRLQACSLSQPTHTHLHHSRSVLYPRHRLHAQRSSFLFPRTFSDVSSRVVTQVPDWPNPVLLNALSNAPSQLFIP